MTRYWKLHFEADESLDEPAALEECERFADIGILAMAAISRAARLPLHVKLSGGRSKGLLRRYSESLLPRPRVVAPKRGFAPDVGAWLRRAWAPWAQQLVHDSRVIEAGLFERQAIRRVAEAHASGREGHGQRLWIFMALEIWWRLLLSREDPL